MNTPPGFLPDPQATAAPQAATAAATPPGFEPEAAPHAAAPAHAAPTPPGFEPEPAGTATPTAHIGPRTEGFWDRARDAVANSAIGHSLQTALPAVARDLHLEPTETVYSPTYRSDAGQILAPQYLVPADAHSAVANVTRGALQAVGGLTSGPSLALLAIPGLEELGLGEVGARTVGRLLSAGFAGSTVVQMAHAVPRLKALLQTGDSAGAEQLLGQLGVQGGLAGLAGAHATGMIGRGAGEAAASESEPAPEAQAAPGPGTEAAPPEAAPAPQPNLGPQLVPNPEPESRGAVEASQAEPPRTNVLAFHAPEVLERAREIAQHIHEAGEPSPEFGGGDEEGGDEDGAVEAHAKEDAAFLQAAREHGLLDDVPKSAQPKVAFWLQRAFERGQTVAHLNAEDLLDYLPEHIRETAGPAILRALRHAQTGEDDPDYATPGTFEPDDPGNAAFDPDPTQQYLLDAGVRFQGKMIGAPGKPALVLFNDPATGSTLALPEDNITPETIRARMAESRKQFGSTEPVPPVRPPVGDVGATAPNLAPNVRLDGLGTSEEVKSAITHLATEHAGALSDQRRGVVPLGTTEAVARRMVQDGQLTPDHAATVAKGTAWNAEQLNAARVLMLNLGEQARDAAQAFRENPTDANLAAMQAAVKKFGAVHATVSGLTAEAGRALGSLRIVVSGADGASNVERALSALGGRELSAKAAAALAGIPEGDNEALAKFLRSQDKWSTGAKVQAWWTASLLSSPRTLAAKLVGDAVMAALDTPVRVTRAGVDAALSVLNAGRPREYFASEAIPALHGFIHGLGEGFGKALFIMRTGLPDRWETGRELELSPESQAIPHELFENARAPLGRAAGRVINFGPRFLRAATAMMETAANQAELEAGALREALREGLTGAAARDRAAQILADPPDTLVNRAADFAHRQTFTRDTPWLRKLQEAVDEPEVAGFHPVRFVLPFLRVPYNIAVEGLKLTPAGLAVGMAKGDADMMARGLIGSAVLAYGAHLAANGYLTGDVRQTPSDRAAFYANGKQPFSVRIGNRWVSYERNFGITGMALAAAAAFRARYEHQGIGAAPAASELAILGLAHMFANLPMVEGINSLAQALANPERFGEQFAATVAEGFVPVSAGLRDAARLQDPTVRAVRSVYDSVLRGIPFAQDALPAKFGPLGHVEVNRGAAGLANAVLPSPISSTAPEGTPTPRTPTKTGAVKPAATVGAELARLGLYPGPTSTEVILAGRRARLSPTEAQARQEFVGQAIERAARGVMADPGYGSATDAVRLDVLRKAVERARRAASREFSDRLKATLATDRAQ